MLKFLDGPAAGKADGLCVRRAPLYLRVVCDPFGKWDCLDALDDRPAVDEAVHVYQRVGDVRGSALVQTKRGRVCAAIATYRLVEPQPDNATVRERKKWQAWASEQAGREEKLNG